MADQREGGISWTDETWNVFRGCSHISAGCANCYAESVASIRLSKPGQAYHGLAVMKNRKPTWTGKVTLAEDQLDQPLRWRRPRKIFTCSMSDVFHESLDVDVIAKAFAVMALAPRHTFQVLTKRAARMREIFSHDGFRKEVEFLADAFCDTNPELAGELRVKGVPWPLPNVWLGVSVEHQDAANERIPKLLNTPAAVRWLSVEPLIEEVKLSAATPLWRAGVHPRIDWVVVGGESGAGHRVMDVEWARTLKYECEIGDIAFWMKQFGGHPNPRKKLEDFPEDLRVREFPQVRT